MPSLNALGEFKFSFSNIGKEKSDLEAKSAPYHDLPLPTTEAAPMDLPANNSDDTTPPPEAGGFDMSAFFDSLPVTDTPEPSTDDFLSSLDLDLAGEPAPDEPFDTSGTEATQADDPLAGFDFGGEAPSDMSPLDTPTAEETPAETPMDDLLGGMDFGGMDISELSSGGEDLSAPSEEPFTEEPPPETPFEEEQGIDLGGEGIDLGGESLDFVEKPPQEESPAEDTGFDAGDFDAGSFDLGGSGDFGGGADFGADAETPPAGDFDAGGFDLGGSADFGADADAPPAGDFDAGGFDLGGDTDFGGSADFGGGADFGAGADFGGDFNLGGEEELGTEGFSAGEPTGEPVIDLGDLGSDFSSEQIDLGSEGGASEDGLEFSGGEGGSEDFGSGDFALDGLEELFEKTKVEPVAPQPKKSFFSAFRKKKTEEEDFLPEAESDIEEIQLSEHDVERLMNTIASYPLNLRIVCEELIAEQVILPKQLSRLLRCLINGASVRETAALAEEITGKPVIIPKSFEKMTGAAFEAEQASFAYIFVHNFLPVFRLFFVIALFIASVAYLGYKFVYIPVKAEGLYKRGYELIPEAEYQRANQLFDEAFDLHKKKKWFYLYAESFRDQRRYMLAEEKYDKLLMHYPRDKKGVLDYANLNTYYLLNYDKASRLLHEQLLDYSPNDYDGLLAAGDNFLLWGDSYPDSITLRVLYNEERAKEIEKERDARYEDARFSYARLLELKGWQPHLVERMLTYFIRTDNLKEVLNLRFWFDNNKKRNLSPMSKAELAGYLLDKQLEETKGVPDPYLDQILSVRMLLLEAITENNLLPEPHYHLARYHHSLNNPHEERLTLENAIRAFDIVERDPKQTETIRRRRYRIDTHFRYSNLLVSAREFFPAEEQIVRSINLYEDFLGRRLMPATPKLGELYAAKGDLEYFVKSGNMEAALNDYHTAEKYGYAPAEIKYRMGSAYYQTEDWENALKYLFSASSDLPLNRRMLYALGNAAYRRADYFAAQGYYNRLINILENQRVRLPVLLPNDNIQFLELGERMMMAYNNLGVVYEALANQTGNREYRARAIFFYSESARAWDSITRNPETMTRMSLVDTPGAPSVNQGYMNVQNAARSSSNYIPQIFPRIDKDVLEPSRWEELAGAAGLQ